MLCGQEACGPAYRLVRSRCYPVMIFLPGDHLVPFVCKQNMEKDKALERRFQQVYVKQPNVEDTVSLSPLPRRTCVSEMLRTVFESTFGLIRWKAGKAWESHVGATC